MSEIDKIMLICFLHLTARQTDIFLLKFEDIDFEKRQVRLYTRKRKDGSLHFDWLPLTDQLYNLLCLSSYDRKPNQEYVFPHSVTGLPFVARQHWLPGLCVKAKVERFGFHGIRHLSASILVKSGAPLIDVQTILRYTKISTTERYIHRLDNVRDSLKVFDSIES